MEEIQLQLNERGRGAFLATEGGKPLGEMVISVSGFDLTVYHTEVQPEAEGKGLAKKLLAAMVDYARRQGLRVIPLCPFVHAQFRRHPETYADVWNNPDAPAK